MLDERSERVNTTCREHRDARHVVAANGAERLDSDLVAHTLHEDNGGGMLDAGNRSAGRASAASQSPDSRNARPRGPKCLMNGPNA